MAQNNSQWFTQKFNQNDKQIRLFYQTIQSNSIEKIEEDKKKTKGIKVSKKIEKTKKIRTNRNVQKTYHNILKIWINQFGNNISLKYEKYLNKRVYFILVIHDILKKIDGLSFFSSYNDLAENLISQKQKELDKIRSIVFNCEHASHLQRVIIEIKYSIQACRKYCEGNMKESLVILFRREKKNITKTKQFKDSVILFENLTGCVLQDI